MTANLFAFWVLSSIVNRNLIPNLNEWVSKRDKAIANDACLLTEANCITSSAYWHFDGCSEIVNLFLLLILSHKQPQQQCYGLHVPHTITAAAAAAAQRALLDPVRPNMNKYYQSGGWVRSLHSTAGGSGPLNYTGGFIFVSLYSALNMMSSFVKSVITAQYLSHESMYHPNCGEVRV